MERNSSASQCLRFSLKCKFERGDDGNDVDVDDDTNNDYNDDYEEEIPSRFVALPRVFLVSTTK